MTQKYTEAKKEGNKRWDDKNLDRMSIALPKGNKERIKEHAAKMGESANKFIARAVDETIQRDNEK